jgi:hypothetical protein
MLVILARLGKASLKLGRNATSHQKEQHPTDGAKQFVVLDITDEQPCRLTLNPRAWVYVFKNASELLVAITPYPPDRTR